MFQKLNTPQLSPQIPRRGSGLTRFIGKAVLKITGWQFAGQAPDAGKFVAIGAPHTSAMDVPVVLAAFWAVGADVSWLGTKGMFRWPFNLLWQAIGGIPVDRSSSNGVVGQMVDYFNNSDKLILALSPEGSRKKVARWKTGFYHIATGANVPVLPITIDFGRKELKIGTLLHPSGDIDADISTLQAFFANIEGRHKK